MQLPQAYPVTVPDDSPVMRGLRPFKVPGRDPLLPPFYEHDGPHPRHRLKFPDSRTFVYLVDPSDEGKDLFTAISNAQRVPSGMIKGVYGTLLIEAYC